MKTRLVVSALAVVSAVGLGSFYLGRSTVSQGAAPEGITVQALASEPAQRQQGQPPASVVEAARPPQVQPPRLDQRGTPGETASTRRSSGLSFNEPPLQDRAREPVEARRSFADRSPDSPRYDEYGARGYGRGGYDRYRSSGGHGHGGYGYGGGYYR